MMFSFNIARPNFIAKHTTRNLERIIVKFGATFQRKIFVTSSRVSREYLECPKRYAYYVSPAASQLRFEIN